MQYWKNTGSMLSNYKEREKIQWERRKLTQKIKKNQRIMICRRKSQPILVLKTNKKYQMIIETIINMYLTLMLYNWDIKIWGICIRFVALFFIPIKTGLFRNQLSLKIATLSFSPKTTKYSVHPHTTIYMYIIQIHGR